MNPWEYLEVYKLSYLSPSANMWHISVGIGKYNNDIIHKYITIQSLPLRSSV